MSSFSGSLHDITIDAVRRSAHRLTGQGLDPEAIDLDALLVAVAEIAHFRLTRPDGEEPQIVRALLDLAARALLWSQSVDDLVGILANMPAEDDDTVEALLAEIDARAAQRTADARREDGRS
jgi:hypothetical protein